MNADAENRRALERALLASLRSQRDDLRALLVRYSELEVPPSALPSGYAALLYLDQLR